VKLKRLGRTGLKVTDICLGTMTFGYQCDQQASFRIMDAAIDRGVNFIDTADVYPVPVSLERAGRTEEIVGKWLEGKRDRIVLATKCRMPMGPGPNDGGLSRKHILSAIDASLRRLGTDYVDLYQVHSPDPETPVEETLSALDTVVQSGKARYIGCSNFPAWELCRALWTSDRLHLARFDSVQPRYNLLFREIENELLPLCADQGVGVIVYNPLAGGFLSGKHRHGTAPADNTRFAVAGKLYMDRYWNDQCFAAVQRLKEFLSPRGKSLLHVALAWVLARPEVTSAIVGATSAEQLSESLSGYDVALDSEEMAACDDVWYELPRVRDPRIALR
jgi:aryl-alcohol dehydrogenase-like predicted oxidoreductase